MVLRDHFIMAAKDYFYLTQKDYPPRGFLQLVGDRYDLTNHERTMLYRGIAPGIIAEGRKQKMISLGAIQNQELFVDGFNVILTISAYLQGLPLFLSNDGFLRDASMMRGKIQMTDKIRESLFLIFDFIRNQKVVSVHFYLDQKVEIHHQIIEAIKEFPLWKSGILTILSSNQVDRDLSEITNGIVCTSDSGIIDRSKSPIFDLAFFVLQQQFHPQIISLNNILNETV